MKPTRLHLGAGTEILEGYVNTDIVDLPGIDLVHNVMSFPWPWEDGSMEEVRAKDLIEHLPTHTNEYESSIIKFIEEAHRILKVGGKLWIQTPRYDAEFLYIDPTHTRGFHEQSFDFFDDTTDFGKSTGFYSPAKFSVSCKVLENKNLQFTLVKK